MAQGVSFNDTDLEKYPGIPLITITSDPEGSKKLMSVLNWIDEQVNR
jgi:hypothetical protein